MPDIDLTKAEPAADAPEKASAPEAPAEEAAKASFKAAMEQFWQKHLKGERLPEEEKADVTKAGVAKSVGLSLFGVAASMVGVKAFADVPRWVVQKYYTAEEQKRLAAAFEAGEAPVDKEEPAMAIKEKAEALERAIDNSRYLSAAQKEKLKADMRGVQDRYDRDLTMSRKGRGEAVAKLLDETIQTRVKGMTAVKETVNSVLMATGLSTLRAAGYGAVAVFERYQKVSKEKQEGKRTESFAKEVVVNGFKETWSKLAWKGEGTKREKAIALASALGTVARFAGLGSLAAREIMSEGVSEAISKALSAWEQKSVAVFAADNFEANLQRVTFGLFVRAPEAPAQPQVSLTEVKKQMEMRGTDLDQGLSGGKAPETAPPAPQAVEAVVPEAPRAPMGISKEALAGGIAAKGEGATQAALRGMGEGDLKHFGLENASPKRLAAFMREAMRNAGIKETDFLTAQAEGRVLFRVEDVSGKPMLVGYDIQTSMPIPKAELFGANLMRPHAEAPPLLPRPEAAPPAPGPVLASRSPVEASAEELKILKTIIKGSEIQRLKQGMMQEIGHSAEVLLPEAPKLELVGSVLRTGDLLPQRQMVALDAELRKIQTMWVAALDTLARNPSAPAKEIVDKVAGQLARFNILYGAHLKPDWQRDFMDAVSKAKEDAHLDADLQHNHDSESALPASQDVKISDWVADPEKLTAGEKKEVQFLARGLTNNRFVQEDLFLAANSAEGNNTLGELTVQMTPELRQAARMVCEKKGWDWKAYFAALVSPLSSSDSGSVRMETPHPADAIDVGKIDASIGAKPIEEPFTLKNVLPERPNKEQMELGFDWMRKEIKEEELRALAEALPEEGKIWILHSKDGQSIEVAGGIGAKQAARFAVEQSSRHQDSSLGAAMRRGMDDARRQVDRFSRQMTEDAERNEQIEQFKQVFAAQGKKFGEDLFGKAVFDGLSTDQQKAMGQELNALRSHFLLWKQETDNEGQRALRLALVERDEKAFKEKFGFALPEQWKAYFSK